MNVNRFALYTFYLFLIVFGSVQAQTLGDAWNSIRLIYCTAYEHKAFTPEQLASFSETIQNLASKADNRDEHTRLLNECNQFISDMKAKSNPLFVKDSLYKPLHALVMSFISTFSNQLFLSFASAKKNKIILITASLSCACTLDMCYKLLYETFCIEQLKKGEYIVFIEDTWKDEKMKDLYKAGFVPTVLVLDGNNAELKRFSRPDSILDKIK